MKKLQEYEVVTKDGGKDVVSGSIWWDGRKVDSDSPSLLSTLKGISIMGKRITDGLAFFNNLPFHFKNGYTGLRRKSKK